MKQVGNNRIVYLVIAASAVSFVIYLSSELSEGQETVGNRRLRRTFSFHPNSQAIGSLAPSASPLRNTSEVVTHGDKNSTSEVWHGSNPNLDSVGCKNGKSLRQNHSGDNLVSNRGKLDTYPEHVEGKISLPVHQSENISEFGDVIDRKTYGKVYTVTKNENPLVQCDIYSGKWVRDASYPLYPAGECPYMSGAFDCKGNGRRDSGYTQWRWQPKDCNIPRLNVTDMLERLRGKRLMFVGDSLNRNQWESLVCILRTAVPQNRTHFEFKGDITTFLAKDYNCTVELFWAPFLVEQDSIKIGNKSREILRLQAIEKHGAYWKDVDILIFNSAHWWVHGNKAATRDFFLEGDYLHPELDPLVAFEKGMTTWAKWIDHNIDPNKSRVFFRGLSPMHFSSEQWHKSGTHKCNFETEPIFEESAVEPFPVMLQVVDKVLRHMKFPVSFLNITRLSDFRKDAHPSVYTLRRNKKLTQEQRNNPDEFGDCSHWCLPGLPDIWNELLYGSLVIEAGVIPSPRYYSH